ncbi:uncharacterized protein LOC134694651 [Mytilus trossulus]|uniref:uncharacterized protein LOC134694651 n=1 Tax=Mytilus trossulus TaxID=6551 RepID=UPI0030049811
MELTTLGCLLTITHCALTLALPLDYRRIENIPIGKFADIIENIRNIESKQASKPSDISHRKIEDESTYFGLFLPLDDSINQKSSLPDLERVEKRQGDWDLDYGLGGGRWGKRSYVLGSSNMRVVRDVDHVDPMNPED